MESEESAEPQETIEFFENRCCVCHVPMGQTKGGRLRRTCSDACRHQLYRMRKGDVEKPAPDESAEMTPRRGRGVTRRYAATCPVCGDAIQQPKTGRKRKTCSSRCRQIWWRYKNPTCLVCGRRFVLAKHQREQKYCSRKCTWRAAQAMQRQRHREREWAEDRKARPLWLPRIGSGYREEVLVRRAGEAAEVIRKREAHPNYRREPDEVETELELEPSAPRQEEEAPNETTFESIRKARQLAYELLEDESKWWSL